MRFSCSIPLPASFRPGDILAFHRRDRQEIAERVDDASFHKGMIWYGVPAYLSVSFQPRLARAALDIDSRVSEASHPMFERMVRRMLGLTQGIEIFEERYRDHPQLGILIAQQPGMRIPITPTPFEALTWAVTGQQISVSAAVSLRRKLIGAVNLRHSCGLFCHPGAHQIRKLREETLRQAGFSTTKARTLLTLSALVADNKLPLDAWVETLPVDVMREQLEAIRGIGPGQSIICYCAVSAGSTAPCTVMWRFGEACNPCSMLKTESARKMQRVGSRSFPPGGPWSAHIFGQPRLRLPTKLHLAISLTHIISGLEETRH